MAKFKPGQSGNPKGKPVGAVNKENRTVKEAFHEAFDVIQKDPKARLDEWGRENPDKFYALVSKLIPAEITGQIQIVPVLNVQLSQLEPPTVEAIGKVVEDV